MIIITNTKQGKKTNTWVSFPKALDLRSSHKVSMLGTHTLPVIIWVTFHEALD